ncbi:MAG: glycosyltransferase family 2 protein [Bacteroidales bacterium]|nr:glycosyltransferase family 2 protein [Bacteroidales bacterium]MCF8457156.1 glycosyltransferase family 2 protein [Bacteroidales bacterium]
MKFLAIVSVVYLIYRMAVSFINLFANSRNFNAKPHSDFKKKISILVPARNEEKNLPRLLDSILAQDYQDFELLVYDDLSTDNTAEIVEEYAKKDARIKLIKGEKLPDGWLGKNHACHNLALHATGNFLFFMDADVKIGDGLFHRVVQHMHVFDVKLLSIFPKQEIVSPGEWMTVPLMNWILLSLLPIPFANLTKIPSLSAANGQFMVFNTLNYQQNMWHEQHKLEWVEDIAIMRSARKAGFRTALFPGDDNLQCRMYHGYKEAIEGFSKNINHFYGNSFVILFLSNIFVLAGSIFVWKTFGMAWFFGYIIGILAIRVFTSVASRQSLLKNLIYHPFQIISLIIISIHSFRKQKTKQLTWKDRKVSF